jgi:signal transduction histidine kinase
MGGNMFAESIERDLRSTTSSSMAGNAGAVELEKLAEIGGMASSISHDIRHWLTIIYANIEFLQNPHLLNVAKQEILVDLQEAVTLMVGLTDSLLQFARTGRGCPPSRTTISRIIDRAIHDVRKHPDVRSIPIVTKSRVGTDVIVDVPRLERAVYNLILNACQAALYSEYEPNVCISLLEEQGQIFVKVIDNGPGVPDCIRDTLFRPFVTKNKHNGTGLGLALALDTAKAHGGAVFLEESARGRTVFTLWLPVERPSDPALN